MEPEASGNTSGSDGGPTAARDSAQSMSGVTEAGSSGNEKARRQGGAGGISMDDDRGDHGRLAVAEKADSDDRPEAGGAADAGEGAQSSPAARRAAARIGWLLLGFLAGAAVAAAVLFVMREDSPATCTVPT